MIDQGVMIVQEETTVRLEMIGQEEMIVQNVLEMIDQGQDAMTALGKILVPEMIEQDQAIDEAQNMRVAIVGMMKLQDALQDLQGAKNSLVTILQWKDLRLNQVNQDMRRRKSIRVNTRIRRTNLINLTAILTHSEILKRKPERKNLRLSLR